MFGVYLYLKSKKMDKTAVCLSDKTAIRGIGTPTTAEILKHEPNLRLYLCKRSDNVHEVFIAQIQEAGEVFGVMYPKREKYPSNEDFGRSAWCFVTLESAEAKYKAISEQLTVLETSK